MKPSRKREYENKSLEPNYCMDVEGDDLHDDMHYLHHINQIRAEGIPSNAHMSHRADINLITISELFLVTL